MDCRLSGSIAGGFVFLLVAVAAAQGPETPAPAEDDTWVPESVKNLTVLPKDTSPEQVMKIMRAWNEALNVGCVFCHVGAPGKPLSTFDYASDSKKRKEVSRIMLRGTMAMNASLLELGDDAAQVSCATCHKRSRTVDDELPPPKPRGEAQP